MRNFYKKMCDIELFLAIFFLVTAVLALFLDAALRTIGFPISWGNDVGLFCFVWCIFLGADIAFREGEFVNIDIVVSKLPQNVKKIINIIVFIIIISFLLLLIYYGIKISFQSSSRLFRGMNKLSYSWALISMPVTSLLMIFSLISKTDFALRK